MWAVWPRILSGGETPSGLIESGWLVPIPCSSGGCHPVYPKVVGSIPTGPTSQVLAYLLTP